MTYKIKALKRLNKYQKDEIINLETICKAFDNTKSSAYDGFYEDTKGIRCFFLGYKEDKALSENNLNEHFDEMPYMQGSQQNKKGSYFRTEPKLVSYMRVYFVEDDDEEVSDTKGNKVEAICFVHPLERRRGCFATMFDKAKKELKKAGIEIIEFIHEPISKDALKVCNKIKAEYSRSEYLMLFNYAENNKQEASHYDEEIFQSEDKLFSKEKTILDNKSILVLLEEASLYDIEGILSIYKELFDYHEQEIFNRLKEIVISDSYRLYKAYDGKAVLDNTLYNISSKTLCSADISEEICITNYQALPKEIVGFISIAEDDDYFCIFDFGVAKKHQKKGYGKAILTELIKKLDELRGDKKSFKIILHVTSKNEAAFNLYKNFGFVIDQQYDYYKLFI